jgi:uncharacterized membrane protein
VIITIMVLELHSPHEASAAAIIAQWPTFASYALSYLFVAIVWANHHHMLRLAHHADGRTIWANFLFLFFVSLIPFCTAYLAGTRLSSFATSLYAALFLCVTFSFMFLQHVIFGQHESEDHTTMVRAAKQRNWIGVACYGSAICVAWIHPSIALLLILLVSGLYLVPEATKPASCHDIENR